jgi:DNA gyrase subunit A
MEVCRKGYDLLVATENGYGKRTPLDEYRRTSRGGLGIKTLNVTGKNGPLVDMKVVEPDDEVILITSEGQIIRVPVDPIRQTGRAAQGVRLIRLDEGDKVAGLARVVKREDEDEEPAGPTPAPPAQRTQPAPAQAAEAKKASPSAKLKQAPARKPPPAQAPKGAAKAKPAVTRTAAKSRAKPGAKKPPAASKRGAKTKR